MAKYQLASDGYDGTARSGVIRDDGKWIPAEAGNPDWYEYVAWLEESPDNNPDGYRSVANGGVAIKLEENQSAVGAMLDSLEENVNIPSRPGLLPDVVREMRIPHRTDVYTPPPVPTDASRPPASDQRSDAYKPRLEGEARQTAPLEGVWTQDQVDVARENAPPESSSDPVAPTPPPEPAP